MAHLGDFSIGVQLDFDPAQIQRKTAELQQQLRNNVQFNIDTTQAQAAVKGLETRKSPVTAPLRPVRRRQSRRRPRSESSRLRSRSLSA